MEFVEDIESYGWYTMAVRGDFNEVLTLDELDGLQSPPNWQLSNFRVIVYECEFVDLG